MNKEHYLDPSPEAIQQLAALPNDQPLHMLNYLKYNEVMDDSGKTGRVLYKEYMQEALPFFEKVNAKIVFKGIPSIQVIGPNNDELWDEILIVSYASKKDFLAMVTMEGYPAHLRSKALKDSRLIFCK
ncbi:hypothetical protein [Spongiivirga citrea]|uniref:DUF1330 domain-containing protein n=1 Tax=Spongiivirga citrea TaxID=1481457 RepID=A0A6M0CF22_9FLAO|nr:hypothetical protein [Spongiivirga citrea]NER16438.1 hypothetical protein [Spongiivirga citrea]